MRPLRRLVPPVAVACVAAVLAAAAAAPAKDTLIAFQTPTHGIGCAYAVLDGTSSLRCDVKDVVDPPQRPKSCELDYGSAFGLSATGRARRLCAGDTALNPKAKVLAYGSRRHLGPFTCTSRTTGLRCVSRAGHGFELSRRRQKLF